MVDRCLPLGRFVAALVCGMVLATVATAGDVTVVVFDYWFQDKPISEAKVFLNSDNAKMLIGTTAAKGTFANDKNKPVANGMYSLEVTKPGYNQMPQEPRPVNIKDGANDLGTAFLCNPNEKTPYFNKNGGDFAKTQKDKPEAAKKTAYAELWKRLTLGNAPPTAKLLVAQAVNKEDESAKSLCPPMKVYLGVSMEHVAKAEEEFGRLFQPNSTIPEKAMFTGELKIPDEVLKEVMLYQFRAKGGKDLDERLFRQLNADSDWKGISKEVQAEHNAMSSKSSRIQPP